MALNKKTQLLRVIRYLDQLVDRPHWYGQITIEFQDSVPLYTRVQEGRRVEELLFDVADEHAATTLLEQAWRTPAK